MSMSFTLYFTWLTPLGKHSSDLNGAVPSASFNVMLAAKAQQGAHTRYAMRYSILWQGERWSMKTLECLLL